MAAHTGHGRDDRPRITHHHDRGDSRYGDRRHPRPQDTPITHPTPCNVTSNMYRYIGKTIAFHQYTVTFVPEVLQKSVFYKFLQAVEANNFGEVHAFDGVSILVSTRKFPDVSLSVPIGNGELVCKIEYKHTHDISSNHPNQGPMMQCMEIVSRYYQKLLFHVEKKKMFSPRSRTFDLGSGLEVLPGLASSIKLCRDGLYLNLDTIFGVFYKPIPLLELVTVLAKNSDQWGRYQSLDPLRDDLGQNFFNDFEKFVKNLKVVTTHREHNSSFRISGVLCQSASSVEFEIDGTRWTVSDYFARTYRPLKYPHLPLAVIKKRDTSIYLPLEVLAVCPMQKYSRKLDENLVSRMIKIAAKKPYERFAMIEDKAVELSALHNDTIKKFGMAFDNKMLNCKGVIIPAPQLSFAQNKSVSVNNGSWNLIGVEALAGVEINDWKIFTFRSNNIVAPDVLSVFSDLASRYGVIFKKRPETIVVRSVSDFFDAKKASLNLVILPDRNAQRYEEVKRIAETYQSVITQCMQSSNIFKLTNPSFVSNLLLKINVKLGGKNWGLCKVVLKDKPTILIGIDINHPGIADLENPSIVSIVGSMDYGFIGYKTIIEQQERRQEIVETLRSNAKILLRSHYSCTKTKPARIVVFRDGIGDSMFDAVYGCEIESIQQACTDLDADYRPEINFIIAQKHHSIRFQSGGRNPVPGTVVDEVGRPDMLDFYLVSHNAIQGTARPVRYLVIRNDSKFSSMEMYEMVYNLCHLYARATKTVSIVPPIYYAHLAAARGKCYLEKDKEGSITMRPCSSEIQKNLYYL